MSVRAAKKPSRGTPFKRGFDPRRNLKGPVPGVFELKEALSRDGQTYIELLFRACKTGDGASIRYALDQILGKPPQSITVSGPGGGAIEVSTARDRLLEKVGALSAAAAQGRNKKPDRG